MENASVSFFKKPLFWIILLAVVVFLGFGVYKYFALAKELSDIRTNPSKIQDIAKRENKKLVEEIGRLMELPKDEDPTVALVNDVERLKTQSFFTNAKNGDKVLIYTTAKKAILYRPSDGKVIEVAPVTIGGSATPSGQISQSRVVLRNATTVAGLAKKYEVELKSKASFATVVDRETSVNQDVTKTILVDLSGAKGQAAQDLAKALGLSLTDLPKNEGRPQASAEYLILLGTDKK
ncbi:LytR C-terminal domain-containing protein [Candidatus Gottesmanbacteria bacterium]|nr:LytR C-terminal domain-containing protein [Candidatus Gottesmanbacteria bacterium]